jgi:hypothetical protein
MLASRSWRSISVVMQVGECTGEVEECAGEVEECAGELDECTDAGGSVR